MWSRKASWQSRPKSWKLLFWPDLGKLRPAVSTYFSLHKKKIYRSYGYKKVTVSKNKKAKIGILSKSLSHKANPFTPLKTNNRSRPLKTSTSLLHSYPKLALKSPFSLPLPSTPSCSKFTKHKLSKTLISMRTESPTWKWLKFSWEKPWGNWLLLKRHKDLSKSTIK